MSLRLVPRPAPPEPEPPPDRQLWEIMLRAHWWLMLSLTEAPLEAWVRLLRGPKR